MVEAIQVSILKEGDSNTRVSLEGNTRSVTEDREEMKLVTKSFFETSEGCHDVGEVHHTVPRKVTDGKNDELDKIFLGRGSSMCLYKFSP